jgi:hypothetical protein
MGSRISALRTLMSDQKLGPICRKGMTAITAMKPQEALQYFDKVRRIEVTTRNNKNVLFEVDTFRILAYLNNKK